MKRFSVRYNISLLLFWVCLLVVAPLQAQSQKPKIRNSVTVREWATTSWDGDDRPYQQIRATIDNAIADGRKPQELLDLYEMTALRQPNDSQLQFKWAYAAYMAAKQTDYYQGERILGKPREMLVLAPFPHSYEYARLIFLTESYVNMPYGSHLQEVSKRLVKKNPADRNVKYEAASNLVYDSSSADRQLGMTYIQELIKAEPSWSNPHGLLGAIYYERWKMNKSKSEGDKAVAEYQECLRLDTLPDYDFRKRAQSIITEIQKG